MPLHLSVLYCAACCIVCCPRRCYLELMGRCRLKTLKVLRQIPPPRPSPCSSLTWTNMSCFIVLVCCPRRYYLELVGCHRMKVTLPCRCTALNRTVPYFCTVLLHCTSVLHRTLSVAPGIDTLSQWGVVSGHAGVTYSSDGHSLALLYRNVLHCTQLTVLHCTALFCTAFFLYMSQAILS